ncbi:MAG: alpha/beta fold hydrolase [Pseudomonadota bacterium]
MSETPDWFWTAIETEAAPGTVDVQDCDINYRAWSEAGKAGLLFIHGHNAHAHWWDFIAPFFKDSYQTVALDLSGMGDSGHRDEYSADVYAAEIVAVADELGMPANTFVVAHSFGGMMALRAFATRPDRFGGLVLVDSGVRHPDDVKEREQQPERLARPKVYPEREIAISRFRLQPPQQCDNQYIVDHIARHSVEYDGDGWVWKFDEEQGVRMNRSGDLEADFLAVSGHVALIYGELSESLSKKSVGYMQDLKPSLEVFEMKDARHHLFLDQPLAFVDQLKAVLQRWQ